MLDVVVIVVSVIAVVVDANVAEQHDFSSQRSYSKCETAKTINKTLQFMNSMALSRQDETAMKNSGPFAANSRRNGRIVDDYVCDKFEMMFVAQFKTT